MKEFEHFAFEPTQCRSDLHDLKQLLDTRTTLSEDKDIRPFFRQHPHLAAFLSSHNLQVINRDRLAFEYDLFGDFSCDIAVGDHARRSYCFIELEDASPRSIFETKNGKTTPEWSRRFDHGYSQIIDWFWKLADLESTASYRAGFGEGPIDYIGMLIVGRRAHLGPREAQRLSWRTNRVVVNSKHVNCFTYDDLYETLLLRLTNYNLLPSTEP